jgi:hypothetical protein
MDVELEGSPVWFHLWRVMNGKISNDQWHTLLKQWYPAEILALCHDAWSPDRYLLFPWPPVHSRNRELEERNSDHEMGFRAETVAVLCDGNSIETRLKELESGFH